MEILFSISNFLKHSTQKDLREERRRSVLRNKKTKNQWSVILNPITSELHKVEAIEKMVAVFPLSYEEASQLVERTPIILLEHLSRAEAERINVLFTSVPAKIVITEDQNVRRKCYRTVWPEGTMDKILSMHENAVSAGIDPGELLKRSAALKGQHDDVVFSSCCQDGLVGPIPYKKIDEDETNPPHVQKEVLVAEVKLLKNEMDGIK
ncbi:MAG: hypothetical protein EOM23_08520, partial [Candidatus Moranbacteria bacterium]|nr:hypothetical protein [Candidatus Moranbacteria bacterium]